MVNEAFAIGETVEFAKERALKILGVSEEESEFEVIQEPEKKVLGVFGGKPAQVRVFLKKVPEKCAENYLKEIFHYMGLSSLEIATSKCDTEDAFNLKVSGADDEIQCIIGRHGETLDALQYLAGLVSSRHKTSDKFQKIRLEAGNYREHRKVVLEGLAKKVAEKVISGGRKLNMEPMKAYERLIVHSAIGEITGVKSWSEGEAFNRHVVVVPE